MSGHEAQNLRGALTALAAMGIYATHDVVVKFLGAHYSAIQIVFFAALLSFPLVALLLLSEKAGGSLWPRHPGWVLARSASAVITGVTAFYAFGQLPLAQTYAILFAIPLIITVLSIPMLGERVRLRRWAAVIVGMVGVLIVLRPGQAALSSGHLAALVAAFTGAMTAVIARKVGQVERPVVLLIYPILGNFFVMGLALPFVYQPLPAVHLGLLAVIAVMGLAGSLLSILSYRLAEAVIVAPMQYSQILWATFYGFLIFNERPDRMTLLGAGIIILSGFYIVLRETRGGASEHQPVIDARGRAETVTTLRSGLLGRLIGSAARPRR